MNLDQPVASLASLDIPGDILDYVFLGRCNFDYKSDCTAPEGQFTDVNIWTRALSKQEMKDWTTCK